jgi:hypothetical protein
MLGFKVAFASITSCYVATDLNFVLIGTSRVALDVLAGVASEYLLNVGRTIRFLCDKYSNSMTAEVMSALLDENIQ